MSDGTDLGRRLREMRARSKKTQDEVALAVGVKTITISRYERGAIQEPAAEIVERLARLYGTTVEWLLRGDEARPVESHVERDDQILRAVEEFVASLDHDELAEYREHDEEWGKGLAFKDLRSTLGIEVTASLIRRLWGERRGQRAGKLRPPPKLTVVVRPGRVKLGDKGKP